MEMITLAIVLVILSILYYTFQTRWNRGVACVSDARVDGKVILITGGGGALASALATELARRGGTIILAARKIDEAETIARDIREKTCNEKVSVMYVDMAIMESVRGFAKKFTEEYERLDVLLHCAGVCGLPFSLTSDGLELTMATNHFGPFLLTGLLMDLLANTGAARVISMAGHGHIFGKFSPRDLSLCQERYTWAAAYFNSQLANILTVKEATRRLPSMCSVSFLAVHPGLVYTPLYRRMALARWAPWLSAWLGRRLMKSVEEGIQTPLFCAVDPSAGSFSGRYLSNCALATPVKTALNVAHSRLLWNRSCEIVGLEHFLAEPPEPESNDEEDEEGRDWRYDQTDSEDTLEETMETLQLVGLDDLHNF